VTHDIWKVFPALLVSVWFLVDKLRSCYRRHLGVQCAVQRMVHKRAFPWARLKHDGRRCVFAASSLRFVAFSHRPAMQPLPGPRPTESDPLITRCASLGQHPEDTNTGLERCSFHPRAASCMNLGTAPKRTARMTTLALASGRCRTKNGPGASASCFHPTASVDEGRARSNGLGHVLRRRVAKPQELVALHLPNPP
jgi:hypothetical protein